MRSGGPGAGGQGLPTGTASDWQAAWRPLAFPAGSAHRAAFLLVCPASETLPDPFSHPDTHLWPAAMESAGSATAFSRNSYFPPSMVAIFQSSPFWVLPLSCPLKPFPAAAVRWDHLYFPPSATPTPSQHSGQIPSLHPELGSCTRKWGFAWNDEVGAWHVGRAHCCSHRTLIHSLIHSFRYLLSTYYPTGAVPGAWETGARQDRCP